MIQAARYVHTNLIARDWRRLADVYQSVFGCVPVPPERDLAFAVASVGDARAEVLAAGGRAVGDVVETTIADGAEVTWCYVSDPEGNIVELQAWT